MMPLVTVAEMRAAEAATIATGTPAAALMRAAGAAVADWVDAHVAPGRRARRFGAALIGPGNNGGDALVALARLVELGWRCGAVRISRADDGALPADPAALARIEHVTLDALSDADVILDGVFGIGARPQLPDPARVAINAAHLARRERAVALVAIDVPTGVDATTGQASDGAFSADITLCLGLPKIGLTRQPGANFVGELVVLPIGIAAPVTRDAPLLLDASVVRQALPPRHADAHKSTIGSVLVIGGADQYFGAPRLSAEAAMRVGAGLVTLVVPRGHVPIIATQIPEVTFAPLAESETDWTPSALDAFVAGQGGRYTAAVIGPGLGRGKRAAAILAALLDASPGAPGIGQLAKLPWVLDADALNWLAAQPGWPARLRARSVVLTPHPGEMSRLLGADATELLRDPVATARRASETWGQVVVFKTGYTPVASPDGTVALAPRATPELATAGTGDVLAGVIGGFLAQGLAPADAARAAVYVGALAGRDAAHARGRRGIVARDVIDALPRTLRHASGDPSLLW